MRDKFVEFLYADLLFEVVEEGKALFVWDGREGIVWVFAFEVDD